MGGIFNIAFKTLKNWIKPSKIDTYTVLHLIFERNKYNCVSFMIFPACFHSFRSIFDTRLFKMLKLPLFSGITVSAIGIFVKIRSDFDVIFPIILGYLQNQKVIVFRL